MSWNPQYYNLRIDGRRILGKNRRVVAPVAVALAIAAILIVATSNSHDQLIEYTNACNFPAIFNFGDSNSDTGQVSAAFGRVHPPYGITYFGRPAGRVSDGRLVIDFIADKLGLPLLNAYLDSMGTTFYNGANFAANGATIQKAKGKLIDEGFSPLSLDLQVSQFEQFMNRDNELRKEGGKSKTSLNLPKLEDFPKALYIFDIGQNDLHFMIKTLAMDQALASLPELIDQMFLAIENIYQRGGRHFWIHNTGPIGCLPYVLEKSPPETSDIDEIGCRKSYNKLAQSFNKVLHDRVNALRGKFQDGTFTYVDVYSPKYTLYKDASSLGFVDPFGYCCKHPTSSEGKRYCWDTFKLANGTHITAFSCNDPSRYINWDGVHYTEAANHFVASRVSTGKFSDPAIPITGACKNQ